MGVQGSNYLPRGESAPYRFTPLAGFPLYDRVARSETLGAWQAQLGVKWAEANADLLTEISAMLTP